MFNFLKNLTRKNIAVGDSKPNENPAPTVMNYRPKDVLTGLRLEMTAEQRKLISELSGKLYEIDRIKRDLEKEKERELLKKFGVDSVDVDIKTHRTYLAESFTVNIRLSCAYSEYIAHDETEKKDE